MPLALCVCVRACMRACVCVCERKGEERGRGGGKGKGVAITFKCQALYQIKCLHIYVFEYIMVNVKSLPAWLVKLN